MDVTVRLKDDLLKDARHKAVDEGLSLSAWLARLIEREVARPPHAPETSFWERVGDPRLAEAEFNPAQ